MLTTAPPGAQHISLPAGYATIERIGSGGYGEVWRATAPGGVEKAVKIVYGHCTDDLAGRELKSLERIRDVRHPFVISLERFEVIDGRLVIVTELADMSLDACFRKHQQAGLPGVPRDELLGYLSDAADALDCLVERHSLQHLDIKPENLLVVGDHVKVGDFGLVKKLAGKTLDSMMGGMTPLYSAPEVFDDNPSPRSDQYSLAIVFQQMLTGQLPFPGHTPAQLAKQHTQAEPNVQPLEELDRPIVRRALAKRPEARFASCREFINALRARSMGGGARATGAPAADTPGRSAAADDTTPNAGLNTQPIQPAPYPPAAQPPAHASAPAAPQPRYPEPDADTAVTDADPPGAELAGAAAVPTLVVAAGGMGVTMLSFLRSRVEHAGADLPRDGALAWLAIDTDRETLNDAVAADPPGRLDNCDALHIPLKRPKQYGDSSQEMLRWVSRRWLYNIPRSLETRGFRPLGRIAAVDHAEPILRGMYTRLQELAAARPGAKRLRVVVLAGASGGTGGGAVVDIAQAARSLAADLRVEIQVDGVLAAPERAAGAADSLPVANFYSLLTELNHTQRHGNQGEHTPHGAGARFEAGAPAFDNVYLVCVPPRTDSEHRYATYAAVAEYLRLDLTTPATASLAACRAADPDGAFRLRSFGCAPVTQDDNPASLLARADARVMNCGHRRQTLLIASDNCPQAEALRALRPTTGLVTGAGVEPVLVVEAAGLNPLTIATRLAEFYPGISDAAGRLHAREDIPWQDLRLN